MAKRYLNKTVSELKLIRPNSQAIPNKGSKTMDTLTLDLSLLVFLILCASGDPTIQRRTSTYTTILICVRKKKTFSYDEILVESLKDSYQLTETLIPQSVYFKIKKVQEELMPSHYSSQWYSCSMPSCHGKKFL